MASQLTATNTSLKEQRLDCEDLTSLLKLRQPGIRSEHHEPVYSCEQAAHITSELPGARTKNLLLRDRKKQRYLLLCIDERKRPDLTALASNLGCGRLSLANENDLEVLLGTAPGALSMLSLLNDPEHRVEVVVDAELQQVQQMLCHPLSNRSTMSVDLDLLLKLMDECAHTIRWLTLN